MAANSTKLLADAQTVITSGPSVTTKANVIAAAGPIMDYIGMTKLVLLKLQEADVLLNKVDDVTDASTDSTNEALIDGVLAALENTGGPSSTLVADLKTVLTNGAAAATKANVNAAAGPIMDYPGNINLVITMFQEVYEMLQGIASLNGMIAVTASGDDSTNKNLLLGIAQVLV